jgi:acetyl esterase/lipase
MIRTTLALYVALVGIAAPPAHADIWRQAAGHVQTPIWPGTPPDPPPMPGPETATDGGVTNVSIPTLTLYTPRANATGTAVVVIPGGGFQGLAMDLEGTEICDWLTSKGVACMLLKYRVPSIPYVWRCQCRPHNKELSRPSLQDVQRTLRMVRAHAVEWRIDPHKVGVIGFSAGGYLVAEASTWFDERLYPPRDAADRLSARPDFAMAIYPGHLAMARHSDALNPLIASHIAARTPPTFLVQAEDDHVDRVEDSISYYKVLEKSGVDAELHTFPHGGHAFGLRARGLPIDRWPELAEKWMRKIGMLGSQQP